MPRAGFIALTGLLSVVCCLLSPLPAMADGMSLLQAVEKIEQDSKMLVVMAESAGRYYRVIAIGDGKTKIFKVYADSGKVELQKEKDWTEKSAKIHKTAKVSGSAAAKNAGMECSGEVQSLKARVDRDGNVSYCVRVKNAKRGPLNATVCACTGRIGKVESAADAAEGCE